MEIKFDNQKTQKIMTDMKLLTAKIGLGMAKTIKQRYNQIEACENFEQYMKTGLGIPHPLNHSLKDCYGIRITGNYRLVVKPESLGSEKIIIKGVLDYHGDKNEWIIP